jgi:anti-sigma B factor antagonist
MLLRIDSSAQDSQATIIAAGEVDLATVGQLSTAIADTIQAGATALTVNLDSVTYLDSTGLGALVGAFKRLTAIGGTLTIRCAQPRLLRLFTVTGLTRRASSQRREQGGRHPLLDERPASGAELGGVHHPSFPPGLRLPPLHEQTGPLHAPRVGSVRDPAVSRRALVVRRPAPLDPLRHRDPAASAHASRHGPSIAHIRTPVRSTAALHQPARVG